MFTEIQMSSEAFGGILRSRLQAIPICPDDNDLLNRQGERVVIDRIVVAGETEVQRERRLDAAGNAIHAATQLVWIFSPTNLFNITVPYVQVRQLVELHQVRVADLEASGDAATPPLEAIPLHIVVNCALEPTHPHGIGSAGPVRLSYALSHVEFGPALALLSPAHRAGIEARIASLVPPTTEVDLGAISRVLGRPMAAVNAGLACDPNGTFVALRIEFDVPRGQPDVNQAFFMGGPTRRLGDRGWALIADARLLVQESTRRIGDALSSQPKVRRRWGPNVTWRANAATLEARVGIEMVDACPFFVDDIDVDVEATIRASFSVDPAQPNVLQNDYRLHGGPSNHLETIACAVTAALLWPFMGPVILRDQPAGTGIAAYSVGLALGPIGTFSALLGIIYSQSLEEDISRSLGANCQKLNDEHYQCRDPLDLRLPFPGGATVRLQLTHVEGAPEGLVMSGPVQSAPPRPAAIEVESSPFGWQIYGSCRSSTGGRGGFNVVYTANVRVVASTGAQVCRVAVIDTPEHFEIHQRGDTWWIRPRLDEHGRVHPSAVFPARLRVVTSAGVRIITLGNFVAITPEEAARQEQLRESFDRMCQIWRDSITTRVHALPKGPSGPIEEPGWRPEVLWQVVVRDLEPDRSLEIASPDGRRLVTAHPTERGVIHATLFMTDEASPEALVLRLSGDTGSRAVVSGTQTTFEPQSTLEVAGEVRSMTFEGAGADRRLIVVDERAETTWNVASPGAPVLLRRAAAPEIQDELLISDGRRLGVEISPEVEAKIRRLSVGEDVRTATLPRVGGLGSSALLPREAGWSLFDLSSADLREMQHFDEDPRVSHAALGGDLMARFDATRGSIGLFRVAQVGEIHAPAE
ncbi:hypothetical protein E4191_10775 [Paracoccus liaowanqingii]|uniref:Uncharacterized protein n=1 Tax=Paracoccus liaowanqingii TaxID=2560053 RepID=A0A4V1BJ57_9RHOB|nr:hypothetical protein [Paracoccus liaowanqingii]QBX35132.1 hypothetical protein E4191_10775 [Paracoccus liaowanqingii]